MSFILDADFLVASTYDCPCSDIDNSGCSFLPKCSYNMNKNDLCGASQKLPDGNPYFDVNNCPGGTDVFRFVGGKA